MVSNVSVQNLKRYSISSDNFQKPKRPSAADMFLDEINKTVQQKEKGSFLSRYMLSPTAAIIADIPFLGYVIHGIFKIKHAAKAGKEVAKTQALKFLKAFPFVFAGWALVCAGTGYLLNRNADKKYDKFKREFDDINTETSARLRKDQIHSAYIGAACSAIGEEITVNKNMVVDPVLKRRSKKLLKHELVHAKQYETIACSTDGIKKLNYAVLSSSAKLMNNMDAVAEMEEVYKDVINDKTGKYDNLTLHFTEADVNFKNYVVGIHTLLTDKNATYNDVPIVIDEKYYQEIANKKGKLSPEEEEKANQYFQAMLDYPKVNFWRTINPFSSYYNNKLEREAYRENPNLATWVNRLFVKD